jgi:hypothetical protein
MMVSVNLYIWFQVYETIQSKIKEVRKKMNKMTTSITALIIGLVAISETVFAFGSGFPGFGLNSENRECKKDFRGI